MHAGKLRFLQTVSLEQTALLFGTKEDVLRDQFVACDVDEQILFLEMLTDVVGKTGEQTDGGGRDWSLSDEDTGMDVVVADDVVESAHLLGTDA